MIQTSTVNKNQVCPEKIDITGCLDQHDSVKRNEEYPFGHHSSDNSFLSFDYMQKQQQKSIEDSDPNQSGALSRPVKMFMGSNKVVILGKKWRLIFGEKPSAVALTFLLINIPMTLFNVFITTSSNFNRDANNPSQVNPQQLIIDIGRWQLLIGLLLQLISTVLLLFASLRDPGIIPGTYVGTKAEQKTSIIPKKYSKIRSKQDRVYYLTTNTSGQSPGDAPPPSIHRMKFCESCTLFRPRKSAHCNQCGNCIAGFDHHCTWLGTCVGKRNYREFLLFVFSIIMCTSFVFSISICQLVLNYYNKSKKANLGGSLPMMQAIFDFQGVVAIILTPYCVIAFWFCITLFLFHMNLIRVNQSTNEKLKSKDIESDYFWHHESKGFCTRLLKILCKKRQHSLCSNKFILDSKAMIQQFKKEEGRLKRAESLTYQKVLSFRSQKSIDARKYDGKDVPTQDIYKPKLSTVHQAPFEQNSVQNEDFMHMNSLQVSNADQKPRRTRTMSLNRKPSRKGDRPKAGTPSFNNRQSQDNQKLANVSIHNVDEPTKLDQTMPHLTPDTTKDKLVQDGFD